MATAHSPRRFSLLTYPRTASNLLIRILALEDQPTLLSEGKKEYFFLPTVGLRFGQSKTAGRHLNEWTPDEKNDMMNRYQISFEALQTYVDEAAAKGKNVYVKEHAPWMMEPVAETKWIFGENSIHESPWTVKTSLNPTHSASNETVLPNEFLKTWLPTFLIRHPALVFPSNYRTCRDLNGPEAAKVEPAHSLEMTMHWSRTLFDWYAEQLKKSPTTSDLHVNWPIVLDADDIMLEPEVVIRYANIVGLDPARLKFSWKPADDEELDKMPGIAKRMLSSLHASTGILEGKTSTNIDIEEEAKKWRIEFGHEEGDKVEKWARAAMTDYEYMKAKRLRA